MSSLEPSKEIKEPIVDNSQFNSTPEEIQEAVGKLLKSKKSHEVSSIAKDVPGFKTIVSPPFKLKDKEGRRYRLIDLNTITDLKPRYIVVEKVPNEHDTLIIKILG